MFFPAPDTKAKKAAASSFSGKKKKQQLQAKRQRKREAEERQNQDEKIEDSIREGLANAHPGEEITLEAVEAAKAEYYQTHGGGGRGARGRREKRRERLSNGQQRGSSNEAKTGAKKGNRSDHEEDSDQAGEEEEYMYDAHGHGVRSAFKKESQVALAARRRLNFLPLADRQFMDAKVGIPLGRWFVMPRRVGDGTAERPKETSATATGDDGETAKECAEMSAGSPSAPQLPRPLVSEDGIGSSLCFPFSVDLPTRGWVVTDEDVSSNGGGGGGASAGFDILSNETTVTGNAVLTTEETKYAKEQKTQLAARDGDASNDHEAVASRTDDEGEKSSDSSDETESTSSSDGNAGKDRSSNKKKPQSPTAGTLGKAEERRFRAYLKLVEAYPLPETLSGLTASSCERNLEVWRQLWRACEASDVNVVVADARYPIVHTHLGLLSYLTRKECKPCVLVLNKSDLVPQSVMECWQNFLPLYLTSLGFLVLAAEDAVQFMKENPIAVLRRQKRAAPIVIKVFTSDPSKDTAVGSDADANTGRRRGAKQRRAKLYEQLRAGKLNFAKDLAGTDGNKDSESDELLSEDENAYDAAVNFKGKDKAERNLQIDKREFNELKIVSNMISDLLATCRALAPVGKGQPKESTTVTEKEREAKKAVVAPLRKSKAKKKGKANNKGGRKGGNDVSDTESDGNDSAAGDSEEDDDVLDVREDDDESFIHIGFIGYPNVGKSSLLNCIRGTKVVSVSPTPGHTKHLQTIPVPAEGVTLLDSPGLVMQTYGLPKPLEAVLGTHQIAQTRDPQSGVAFLASHLPLEKIYGLSRPEGADTTEEWSAYELCESYAKKRGYFVKHGKGALDVHRAAIAILQEAYQGRLTLYYAPPELNYLQSKQYKEYVQPNLLLRVFKEN